MNAIKRYVNAVDRRLHLPLAVRARVMSDFATTIQSLREEGLDDEAIMKKLLSLLLALLCCLTPCAALADV